MRAKLIVAAVAIIAITATLGASAFTTGSVSRTSTVNVVSDDTGLIGLSDGTSGDLVQLNSTGQLEIDFTNGGATGVNQNATFVLGDTADPTNSSAFTLTNQDAASHDLTVEYTGAGGTADPDANIEFSIHDSTGAQVTTVSEESTSGTITGAASGATYYVVITVDTHGLSSSSDLSGTLKVSA